ncbi:hypothetical protein D3C76_1477460 [compost metagenome]
MRRSSLSLISGAFRRRDGWGGSDKLQEPDIAPDKQHHEEHAPINKAFIGKMDEQLHVFLNGHNGYPKSAEQQVGFMADPVVIENTQCKQQEKRKVHPSSVTLKKEGVGYNKHYETNGCKG